MSSVKEILNEVIAVFLVDYASIRGVDFPDVFEAYKQFYEIYGHDYVGEGKRDPDSVKPPQNIEVYNILLDNFFYTELDRRINKYFRKMYDKYVPGMTEKAKDELEQYIQQKNKEKDERIDDLLASVDKEITALKEDHEEAMAIVDSFSGQGKTVNQ